MSDEEQQIGDANFVDIEILDELDQVDPNDSERFEVSSYGWDVDVEGLVKRMDRGDIHVPGFQRGFVWSRQEQSRFIESLILGLPVPTLFLAREAESNKLNIIDGQQRLKTLQSFLNGEFPLVGKEIPDDLRGKYFKTRRDKSPTSKILDPSDERTLSDAVMHSIVIRPSPKHDDTDLGHEYNQAIIQIFKRLNTSGKALTAQEVRASIFHGELLTLIQTLNQNGDWRALFGPVHSRMKDQEAVLRVLALYQDGDAYKASMPKFLDNYMEANRHMDAAISRTIQIKFETSVKLIRERLGADALKRSGTFILTRFDALMVGIMELIPNQTFSTVEDALASVEELLIVKSFEDRVASLDNDTRGINEQGEEIEGLSDQQRGYLWSVAKFTNDTNRVSVRLRVAKELLAFQ